MSKKYAICSLGCKVNQYESDCVAAMFEGAGYSAVDFHEAADVYIINTCTVTALSDKKSRQMIRRAGKQNPDAIVVAMGCYAQISPGDIEKIKGVDIVIGNSGKSKVLEYVENELKRRQDGTELWERCVDNDEIPSTYEYMNTVLSSDRARAFVKIQDGCNRFCSYCIIPYARGRIRSRDLDDIMTEIRSLTAEGFKEVVLTGIHVASYGMEEGRPADAPKLIDVIEHVCGVDGIERVRIGSLEAGVITDEFCRRGSALKEFCPQFHLSLQSGCDSVLKRMNRKYTSAEIFSAVELIRRYMPEAVFTTDIIVGFPGETDEDFETTVRFARRVGFMKIHVFPYSPRKGTVAAKYKDAVSPDVKKARTERMIQVSDELGKAHMSGLKGKVVRVLVEQRAMGFENSEEQPDAVMEGHTALLEKVLIDGVDQSMTRQFVDVMIQEADSEWCRGAAVNGTWEQ